ncbi:hypothetical protein QKG08_14880 [Clavibacter michiganensis]|uniref:DUF6545 domain-containing protein n=1 Tax=Clavibacter michiganensis TaxID=28447 RepID=UPI0026DCD89F|nr:DUF6545 domain-containing protein [Clavibacter michiganensis]MDO4070336.1 hypothetical protein [Clavibacter michiganensis]
MTVADLVPLGAWVAWATTMRRQVRTKRSMLPTGVFLWALACTLTNQSVYEAVDPMLGGGNLVSLIYRSLCVLALGCLEVMLLRATEHERGLARKEALVAAVTAVILTVQVVVFAVNEWPITDDYLTPYGGEIGREVFFNIMPLTIAAFSLHVLASVGREWGQHAVRATRWGLAMIGVSAIVDLTWFVEGIVSSALRVFVDPSVLGHGRDPLAQVLVVAMIATTGLGVALASAESMVDRLWMRILVMRLGPLWRSVIRSAPQLSLGGARWSMLSITGPGVENVLYRRWVEMLDCERAGVFTPSARQQALLDQVRDAFVGPALNDVDSRSAGLSGLLRAGAGNA